MRLWDTSKYRGDRAAGALAHAKYKELPAVRARRIKGIQPDLRKQERNIAESEASEASEPALTVYQPASKKTISTPCAMCCARVACKRGGA